MRRGLPELPIPLELSVVEVWSAIIVAIVAEGQELPPLFEANENGV
jgi:hypothetical protein